MRPMEALVIWANRLRNRFSKRRFPAENVLLLLAHCLQNQDCDELVKHNIFNCKECGRCKMKALRALAERTGVQVHIASGGRGALEMARADRVRAILAVACSKEMAEGIRAAFPKRVVSILNSWPHGPCRNTDVDVSEVEAALDGLIEQSRISEDTHGHAARMPSAER